MKRSPSEHEQRAAELAARYKAAGLRTREIVERLLEEVPGVSYGEIGRAAGIPRTTVWRYASEKNNEKSRAAHRTNYRKHRAERLAYQADYDRRRRERRDGPGRPAGREPVVGP